MSDYSAPKVNKKLLEALAKDKGNRIALLNAELKELEEALPGRLQLREGLERTIGVLKEEKSFLESDTYNSKKQLNSLKEEIVKLTNKKDLIVNEEATLRKNIRDLEDKRQERDTLATTLRLLRDQEAELSRSVKHKELELRSIMVRMGPMQEREDMVRQREENLFRQSEEASIVRESVYKRIEELKTLIAKNEEQIRYIDLGGKTMGYYIRGIQKIFDERGIKLNFIELLNEIK